MLALGLAGSASRGQDLTPPTVLELNRASRAELESLPGLGPSLVGLMLGAREQAPFRDWQDLARRVKGMGPRSMARLSAAGLRINGQALEGAPAGRLRAASSPAPGPAH
ncbi:MAG TPA: helix-hairpin-helix domain-containing protein [Burkholderiaceae bacterium]|nr:helix-hairpin-helix domain-containing protein [Burkholderiaceae bacterium]